MAGPTDSKNTVEAGAQITRDNYAWGDNVLGDAEGPITFGFRLSAPPYNDTGHNDEGTFKKFTQTQIDAAVNATHYWSDLANITFTRVGTGDTGDAAYTDSATILFSNYSNSTDKSGAFGYYPHWGTNFPSADDPTDNRQGDVWVNKNFNGSNQSGGSPLLGNYPYETLIHELGHALGLEHPAVYDASDKMAPTYTANAKYKEDDVQYTVMSYFPETNTGANFGGLSPETPMLDDIAAIQRLYGVNTNTRTGDTTYGFNWESNSDFDDRSVFHIHSASQKVVFTVWDAGGDNDTFDFSGYSQNATTIDLNPGQFSSVGGLKSNVAIADTPSDMPAGFDATDFMIENAIGGSGKDTIIGNIKDNHLEGMGGNDTITGGAGNDLIDGGAGTNIIDGGDGIDTVDYSDRTAAITVTLAGPENAIIKVGGVAKDTVRNIENVTGGSGNDMLGGDSGVNVLRGGAGDDVLNGGGSGDTLDGGAGFDYADYKDATAGITVNLGSPVGNSGEAIGDTYVSIEGLRGSAFDDTLTGDSSDNFLRGGLGGDKLDGGAGFDYADYKDAAAGVTVSLGNPALNFGEAENDSYTSIEGLRGSRFADILIGSSGDDFLRGGLGGDKLDGAAGFDYADYQNATSGVTVSLGNPMANTGEAMGDTFISIEGLRGSAFSDTLIGNTGDNFLRGGLGADTLNGGAGFDYADYRNAISGVTVSLATPAINTGEAKGDTFISVEGLRGSDFDDTLIGNAASNFLRGGLGADHLDGGAGFDYAAYNNATAGVTADLANPGLNTGEATGDTYVSIEGLSGSTFVDTLIGDANNNFLRGGAGGDKLDGGGGYDFADYFASASGVTANLADSTKNTGDAAGDTYVSIQGLRGTMSSDSLVGDASDNQFFGLSGNDTIDGGSGGNDAVDYSADQSFGGSSGVSVNLLLGTAKDGFGSTDTLSHIQTVTGTQFKDTLIGDANSNFLRGLGGADTIDGGDGTDWVFYAWDQSYGGKAGVNVNLTTGKAVDGFGATDTLSHIENVGGTALADTLAGSSGINVLEGFAGNDMLDGRGGVDVLYGDSGNDVFVFRRGEANGDVIHDFTGNGSAAGDTMRFIGFGTAAAGAKFIQDGSDPTRWHIISADHTDDEVINLTGNPPVHSSDYVFA